MMARARLLSVVTILLSVLAGGSCDLLLTEPAPARADLGISLQVIPVAIGGEAAAFSRVNRVFLRFVRADSSMRDTVLHLRPQDGRIRTVIALETVERISALGIGAELRAGPEPLFQGGTIARIEPGTPTTAEIPLSPIPRFVRADRPTLSLPNVGSSTQLTSAVLFATTDTITGLEGIWFSDDPTIVSITPSGLALAGRVGATRLIVEFGPLADTVPVQVVAPF